MDEGDRLEPRAPLAPLRVERLAPPSPGAPASAPAAGPARAPAAELVAELVTIAFEAARPDDPRVASARERAAALDVGVTVAEGGSARRLLLVPEPAWVSRRRRAVTFPAQGPDPSLGAAPGEGAALELLLVAPAAPLAFGDAPGPAADWERWVVRGQSAGPSILRVSLRGTLVAAPVAPGQPPRYLESPETLLLGAGRAVLVAGAESRDGWLEAVEAFAFLDGQLARLERETASAFAASRANADLLRPDGAHDAAGEGPLLEHARRVLALRRAFALVEPLLDDGPADLGSVARPLFQLLAENRAIERRLEALDDRLEVLEDENELLTGRLLELGVARRELRVEWLIVAILALELLGVGVQAYFDAKRYKEEPSSSDARGR